MTKLAVHKVLINAPIETVWEKLVDWQNWTKWDKGMKSIQFKEPLALHAKGKIYLGKGLGGTLVVTEFNQGESYKSEFKLFGSRYEFEHDLEQAANFTLVTFRVNADGYLAEMFQLFLMAKFSEALPQWMDNFKRLIEPQRVDQGSSTPEIDRVTEI
ncbi:MAG: SRPBCC family protein [Cyanobacteria bacterium SZAS-4]|nr:SRPBCC family protein [Cyanobacteria bacterium SZAS-4]